MTLKEVNEKLKEISSRVANISSLNNEAIEWIGKQVETLINSDEGALFEMDGIENFDAFIDTNLEELRKFDKNAYFAELFAKDFSKATEFEIKANDRDAAIKQLISKIERMGNINTVIKETQSRYNEKNLDNVFETENSVNSAKVELENKKIAALSNFKDEVEEDFKIIDLIKEVNELEAENKKIDDDIDKLKAQKANLSTPDFQAVIEKKIEEKNKIKDDNQNSITEKKKIINGRTENDVKNAIRSKIPADLDKTSIEVAIMEKNPREALNNLISKSQTQMLMYQNRINKHEERTGQINVGRTERKNRKTVTPLTFNPEDYPLSDSELKDIENEILAGGDKINELRDKVTAEIDALPVPEGKDLRKQVKDWLDNEKGKTRNPFKNMVRRIQSNSEKTQNEYMVAHKKEQIEEKVRKALIEAKQKDLFENVKEAKRVESKSKTNTLDNLENSWRRSIRIEALGLSNEELNNIIKEGKYGERASQHYGKVANEETQKDDDEFIH